MHLSRLVLIFLRTSERRRQRTPRAQQGNSIHLARGAAYDGIQWMGKAPDVPARVPQRVPGADLA